MQLETNESEKKSQVVFIRVTPEMMEQCQALAEKAGIGVSTLFRRIVEGALEEGIEIVGAPVVTVGGKKRGKK